MCRKGISGFDEEIMNIDPNKIPEPISEWIGPLHNQKFRDVVCYTCKYVTRTDLAGPICPICRSNMITVLK